MWRGPCALRIVGFLFLGAAKGIPSRVGRRGWMWGGSRVAHMLCEFFLYRSFLACGADVVYMFLYRTGWFFVCVLALLAVGIVVVSVWC